jgi:hypothetical protein
MGDPSNESISGGANYGCPGDHRTLSELLLALSIHWVREDGILYLKASDALKAIIIQVLQLHDVKSEWALPSLCLRSRLKMGEPKIPATVVEDLVKLTDKKRREEIIDQKNSHITGYMMSLALEEALDMFKSSAWSLVLLHTTGDGTLVTDNFSQVDILETPGMIIHATHPLPTINILVAYRFGSEDKFVWVKLNPPSFSQLNAMGIYFVNQLMISNREVDVGQIANVSRDMKDRLYELWKRYAEDEIWETIHNFLSS